MDFPVVLAALAGYSDLAYRLICRRLGAGYCATEMMLDRLLLIEGKLRRRLVKITDEDHPVAGQLLGNAPAVMARAAVVLCEMGFDVVDLNFACPVRKTLRRRRGGYLMCRPDLALEIVRAVMAVSSRPVTLKLRRSFDEADRDNEAFWEIASGALEAGVAGLCVHGRSVEAKYTGPADWKFIASVKRKFPDATIIGSGDLFAPADALRMLEETGVDGVAVARGAIGNPWFFRQVRDIAAGREAYKPGLAEQREVIASHFDHVCELYGPRRGPRAMRKFGIKYARIHPHPREVRNAFVDVKNAGQWRDVLEKYYADR